MHTGSPNFAAWLTLPSALDVHRRIGARAKQERLRALRERFGVFAVMRPGPDADEIVRATPALFSHMSDAHRLLEGLETLVREAR